VLTGEHFTAEPAGEGTCAFVTARGWSSISTSSRPSRGLQHGRMAAIALKRRSAEPAPSHWRAATDGGELPIQGHSSPGRRAALLAARTASEPAIALSPKRSSASGRADYWFRGKRSPVPHAWDSRQALARTPTRSVAESTPAQPLRGARRSVARLRNRPLARRKAGRERTSDRIPAMSRHDRHGCPAEASALNGLRSAAEGAPTAGRLTWNALIPNTRSRKSAGLSLAPWSACWLVVYSRR
jgi:hypothetical protein